MYAHKITVKLEPTDLFQSKTSTFSTRALILVNPNFVSKCYQLNIYIISHKNSLRRSLVFELCRGSSSPDKFPKVVDKINLQF